MSSVVINPGSGGSTIVTETITATSFEMPVSKIRTGGANIDGGDVTITNPLPIQLSDGAAALGTAANPLIMRGAPWVNFASATIITGQIQAAVATRILRRLTAYNRHSASVNIAIFNGAGTWGTNTNLVDMFAVAANLAGNPRDFAEAGAACPSGVFCLISTGNWTAAIAAPATGCDFWGLGT